MSRASRIRCLLANGRGRIVDASLIEVSAQLSRESRERSAARDLLNAVEAAFEEKS
jgi:hypothetical protein